MITDDDIKALDEPVEQPNLPEAEVNATAPADRQPAARDETGKFAPKDGKKEEPKAVEAPVEQPKHEPKTIPLAAHLEEKNKLAARLEVMERELNALKNPPKQPAPQPEFNDDPKGYIDHQAKSVVERLEATSKQIEEAKRTAEMSAQQAEHVQFVNYLQQAEAQFVAQTPDYHEALTHIRQIRAKQLKVFDPNINDDQVRDTIIREEMGLATQLAKQGRNPAQTAYQIAQAYGYTPKQAAAQQEAAPELPKVAGPKQLPPDQTLGSGSAPVEDATDITDSFDKAFSEMFGKRKRA
jgi:hypothetical protein